MNNDYSYLDMLEKKLDKDQKEICCRAENTIAAAGAGSGKTQVLATRFAWLVMSKDIDASKILTLTFTKKAAGEMYERIFQTLSFFEQKLQNLPEFENEYKRAKKALENFTNVHIQTLDSYCAGIVRQGANRYGIRPDFTSGNKDILFEIKQEALPFVLSNRNRLAVKSYAKEGGLEDFANNVIAGAINSFSSLADTDDYFLQKMEVQCKIIADATNYFLFGNGFKHSLINDDCKTIFDVQNELKTLLDEVKESDRKKYENFYTYIEELCILLADIATENLCIQANDILQDTDKAKSIVNKLCSIKNKMDNKVKMTNTRDAVSKAFNSFRDNTFSHLKSILVYLQNKESIKDFLCMLDEFNKKAKNIKLSSGCLSFRDIQKLAILILREQDDIRVQEQLAYDKIMIDEFQDNNAENRDLLFMLSDKEGITYKNKEDKPCIQNIKPDKLFFVGDEKQSIYKFRGADVAVFNMLKKDFEESFAGSVKWMTNNYRSSAPLLSSFNALFGGDTNHLGVFDKTLLQKDYPYEAQYEKDATKKDEQLVPLTKENVAMHFCIVNKNKLEELESTREEEYLTEKEQLAFFIAKKIKELLCKHSTDEKKKTIAILDRSRTDRATLTRWLNLMGISYTTDQQSNIFDEGPACDIYNFLRLCIYPSDTKSYLAYLCSPFAGLLQQSAEGVLACILQEFKDKSFNPLLCNDKVLQTLDESEKQRFISAIDFYKDKAYLVQSQPLTKTLNMLWDYTGYRYETLLGTTENLYAQQYDMLFELARLCDVQNKSASWFVDELSAISEKESSSFAEESELDVKEVLYPIEKESDVQIMTIHKSKGLQFDYVFVYGCMNMRSRSDGSQISFREETGISIKPEAGEADYFVLREKQLEKLKEIAEFRRLIYVAITRAITEVYIVGSTKSPDSSFDQLKNQLNSYYPPIEEQEDLQEQIRYTEQAPFDFTNVKLIKRTEANSYKEKTSAKQKRLELFKTYEQIYSKDANIVLEQQKIKRVRPSKLEKEDTKGFCENTSLSEEYEKVLSKIICKESKDKDASDNSIRDNEELCSSNFYAKDFGTVVHSYLENAVNGIAPETFEVELKLLKSLSDSQSKAVKNCCIKMTNHFFSSDIGKIFMLNKSKNLFYRAEYEFKTSINDYIVHGSIDLLFENADKTYTIVDYKSTKEIDENKFVAQQYCYRVAASRLLGIPLEKINCLLYFLRYDKTLDITKKVNDFDIKEFTIKNNSV